MFHLATVRSPAHSDSVGSSYGMIFVVLHWRASLLFGEKVDLYNSAAVLTKAREVACGHEISHAAADHDAGVHTALAHRNDL
jgi:hypothetical protein